MRFISARFSLQATLTFRDTEKLTAVNTGTESKMENGAAAEGRDPSGFLSEIIGAPVTVKLNSGVVYKGKSSSYSGSFPRFLTPLYLGELQSVDGYMNIALEKCEEYVNGQKRRSYGDAFVRGNNGIYSPHSRSSYAIRLTIDSVMYISADS